MQDRLNFFEPWERLPANHENQLTRALLVVLRYCPIIHQAWLSLVDAAASPQLDRKLPKLTLHSLPRPIFATQRAQILNGAHQLINEPIKGISVLCSADASNQSGDEVVSPSSREQVLDGIMRYGDDIVIVIESKLKLHGRVDSGQASNINLHGQPVSFDSEVRKISWQNILASFIDLADENRGLISGAEREILNDFLDFVDRNFPKLGPFNTLASCAEEPSRITRRLHKVLSEVLGTDDKTLPGVQRSVSNAYLGYNGADRTVSLRMYPADTLEQARSFYIRPEAVERVLELQNEGWSISPNFHFGFMAKGLCWTDANVGVAEYLRYWQAHIGCAGQIERSDWDEYWRILLNEKMATPENREQFDRDFTNTEREFAAPRPGVRCTFAWHLDEAERLDARGQLNNAVRERINQLLDALGEDRIDPE